MGFLDAIKEGASSIVQAGSSVIDQVQDIRGQKKPAPPAPAPTPRPAPAPAPTPRPAPAPKVQTKIVEKPTYIQAPPQQTIREVVQSPQMPPVSYTQDKSQWRTPEYEQAASELSQAEQAYVQNPTYQAGVEDVQRQIIDEQKAMEEILSRAHSSYESMKEASEFKGYWEDKSTGSKVMAAIGLIFGAMGQGMHGKKNVALEILLKNIDKDVEIKEKRILNNIRKINYSSSGANLKAKKIELLNKQLNDLSLGKPYAVAAAQAAALAKKTGNPTHEQASMFINQALDLRNLQNKVQDLKNLKEETLSRNYAEMEQAPRSTLTKETVTGKMLNPIVPKSGGRTKDRSYFNDPKEKAVDTLRKAAVSSYSGKMYQMASNAEVVRRNMIEWLKKPENPYTNYPTTMQALKTFQLDASVVRGEEMNSFKSTGSMSDKIINWVNGMKEGVTLRPNQKKEILDVITDMARSSSNVYEQSIESVIRQGDRMGIDPDDYLNLRSIYPTKNRLKREWNKKYGK